MAHDGKATSSQTHVPCATASVPSPPFACGALPRSRHLVQATFPSVPALLVGPSDPDSRPLCPQEKRIASLDAANARLMSALTQLKERYSMQARNGISPTNPTKLQITENGEFRNSSNC